MWSDGLITVNGKTVSKVLVEGKTFFGSNVKVATQNLPKESIEKIQVYEEKKSADDMNGSTNVNIVLKKGKKNGLFGKISTGQGTRKAYDYAGLINYFNPKTQVSIAALSNDVNKTVNSVSGLMNYSSYKGDDIGNDYISDFGRLGVNRTRAGGYNLEHELNKYTKLKSEYFLDDLRTVKIENSEMLIGIDNQNLSRTINNTNRSDGQSHLFDSSFILDNGGVNGDVTVRYSSRKSTESNTTDENTYNEQTGINSTYLSESKGANQNDSFSLSAGLRNSSLKNRRALWNRAQLNYILEYEDNKQNFEQSTTFSANDDMESDAFDRNYIREYKRLMNKIDVTKESIFGDQLFGFFRIDFQNSTSIHNKIEDTRVFDVDERSREQVTNDMLTNHTDYNVVDNKTSLILKKSFFKKISNRYSKSLSIDGRMQGQYYQQSHQSLKAFQLFDKHFLKFTPQAAIAYKYEKNNAYQQTASLNFRKTMQYPQVDDLVPLIDSINPNYRKFGNPDLKPASDYNFELNLQHSNLNNIPLIISLTARAGFKDRAIGDSSLYDIAGRNNHYKINVDNQRYYGFSGSAYKAIHIKKHGFQISYSGYINHTNSPGYINSKLVTSINSTTNHTFGVDYAYEKIGFNISQKLETYKLAQTGEGIDSHYSNNIATTVLTAQLRWPKNTTLVSNINFSSTNLQSLDKTTFTIWNASAKYRFLKAKNAEIMLSALDLLRQNTGIRNYVSFNTITKGQSNVLRQYFMVSLSFFPRKFGF